MRYVDAAGAGWFCERVVVKEGPNPDAETYYFPCGRWLDDGLDDGRTERLLERGEPPKESRKFVCSRSRDVST